MALVEDLEDPFVDRLDGAGDERASRVLQRRELVVVADEVLDLDRHVVGQRREAAVQLIDDRQRVSRAVEEVGVAEGDVLRAGVDLLADVLDHDITFDDPEAPAVDRHDRTVPAQMAAASRRLGVADDARLVLTDDQRGIALRRRQPGSVGDDEFLTRERDDGLHLRRRLPRAREPVRERRQTFLELAAEYRDGAEAPEVGLVDRGIQAVEAQMRIPVELANPFGQRGGKPARGVHRHVDRDQVGLANRLLGQRLNREVECPHREPVASQPCGGRRESEGLAAELVRRYQQDPEAAGVAWHHDLDSRDPTGSDQFANVRSVLDERNARVRGGSRRALRRRPQRRLAWAWCVGYGRRARPLRGRDMASDVITELPTVHVSDAAAVRLRAAFTRRAAEEGDQEQLLAALLGTAHDLPLDVLESVLRLRVDPAAPGALLITGMPLDDVVPPTPTEPVPPTFGPGPVSRCAILLPAILLGEPVAYAAEKDGALVQNVFPTRAQREQPSNESSTVGLEFHTELTFSREIPAQSFDVAAPDFVLLLALRSPPARSATTSVIHASDLCRLLDRGDVDALRQPWFELRAPHSFTQDANGSRPWSPPLALVSGPDASPSVVFDISCGVRGRTPEADAALQALRRACADSAIHYSVTLREGDLLIIDNHKCAHARSPYDAQFDGHDRWLHRAYVRHSIRTLRSAPGRSFRVLA